MANETYMIVFDGMNPIFDPLSIRRAIKNNPSFPKWWNHLSPVFLVSTALTVDAISKFIEPVANGVRFLVIEVDPSNSDGLLPERSWDWIRQRELETMQPEQA